MYDNLKEKTSKIPDTSVDDTHMPAQAEHDYVRVFTRDPIKNAGVEARTVSDNATIEARNIVSDPGKQKAGIPLTKAEI